MDARQALEAAAKVAERYIGVATIDGGRAFGPMAGSVIAAAIRAIPIPEPKGTARERARDLAKRIRRARATYRLDDATDDLALALTEAEQRGREAERKEISGWQTMDTAPKGRKVIVGYYNTAGRWRSVMACYYEAGVLEREDEVASIEGWYEEAEAYDDLHLTDRVPIYWRPLPEPPADAIDRLKDGRAALKEGENHG